MSHRVSSEFPKTIEAQQSSSTYQAPFGQEVSKAQKIYEGCVSRRSSDNVDAWRTGQVFSYKESARHATFPNRRRLDASEPAIPESPSLDDEEFFAALETLALNGSQSFTSSDPIAIPRGKSDPFPQSPDLTEDESSTVQKDVPLGAEIKQLEAEPEDIFAFLS